MRHASDHNYRNSSFINCGRGYGADTRSTERISSCRILLHDTLLKSDTRISTFSTSECGCHSETVEHFILHCPK